MRKIHVDTDIGGDMDDVCALAMLFVAIGPYTNLMLLEKTYPGILKQTNLFLMGGHVFDIPAWYPQWSNEGKVVIFHLENDGR